MIAVVLLAAVPALALSAVSAREARDEAVARTEADARVSAARLAHELDDALETSREVLSTMSLSLGFLTDGIAIARDRALLEHVLERHPELSNILVAGADGQVVVSAVPVARPTDLGDRDYWKLLVKGEDFGVGSYTVGRVTGLPLLTMAYAIRDDAGRLEGAVVSGLGVENLSRAINQADLPSFASYTVLDRNGVLLAQYPTAENWIGRNPGDEGLVGLMMSGGPGSAEVAGPDGYTRFYAHTSTSATPGALHVAVGIPGSLAYASANQIVTQFAAGLVVNAFLIALAAWLGAGLLVLRPVRRIVRVAQGLSSGDLSVRTGLGGSAGELGKLADTFDQMAGTIEERTLALQQAEERYRTLVESSPVAIVVHRAGRIVYMNPAGMKLAGASSMEEVVGRGILDFVHPDYHEVVARRVAETARSGRLAPPTEEMFVRVDGTTIMGEVVSIPFTYEGQPAVNSIILDISERKRAQAELRESEEKLRRGQRLEAIGRLAGGVAHDFNNVLTAVIGHVDLLRATLKEHPEAEDDLDEIRKAAERAAALTRQLLAFGRRQALRPRVFDLNETTESMAGMLQRLIGEEIDLVFQRETGLGPVEADPGQVEQVLMNLVINARDAMPEGGKITIETANVELDEEYAGGHVSAQPGPHVMLAVTDTGTGIPKEILPHIFDPFFTTKDPSQGTGLGLSTVYGIVKQSGGNIWVYSEPGCGTTFKIYLPRTDKPVDWRPDERNAEGSADVQGGHECVLVVEDEPTVRFLAARILAQHGYRVLEAGSFEEGLAAAGEHGGSIDLLLSDVILPGMSGRQLAEELARRQQIPPAVLYMSGYTKNAIVHDGRLDEGIDFLEKPFTPEALLRKVREVLDRP
ncbi:MAG: ATP-binding protein [Thermoleophilia bacterium]|nr:ATP-binding protein [Thermoleophilia bacterium]